MDDKCAAEIERLLGEGVSTLTPVAGGDINLSYSAQLRDGRRLFVKTHAFPAPAMYICEVDGLVLLQEARALRIPKVLAVSERLLALEWIETSQPTRSFDETFGRGLATLHCMSLPTFGLAQDNFLGSLPQINTPLPAWHIFYAERRIRPLALLAYVRKLIDTALLTRIEALCERLDQFCGPSEPIARLHGDLWSGNVMCDETGNPVLIDPAVYGGHREVDLAMLRLFGSPSARFFAAYEELYPLNPGVAERVSLYQIYPLLAHVCLFGKSYVSSLTTALSNYE